MTPQTIAKEAYEKWHDSLDVDVNSDTPWHRSIKAHLVPERDIAGKAILEIGCGRGGFASWLAEQRPAPRVVVAADFSYTAVHKGQAFAARRSLSGIRWEVADIQNMAHRTGGFDTVISCETVEHVPDPQQAFHELSRVLRPGGRLFLTTPNYLGPIGLYRIYLRAVGRRYTEEGQPINNFMLLPRTRHMAVKAGLRVKIVEGTGHYLPFPGRPPIELATRVRPEFLTRWIGLHSLVIGEKPVA